MLADQLLLDVTRTYNELVEVVAALPSQNTGLAAPSDGMVVPLARPSLSVNVCVHPLRLSFSLCVVSLSRYLSRTSVFV